MRSRAVEELLGELPAGAPDNHSDQDCWPPPRSRGDSSGGVPRALRSASLAPPAEEAPDPALIPLTLAAIGCKPDPDPESSSSSCKALTAVRAELAIADRTGLELVAM